MLIVNEYFTSLQGESSFAGQVCAFIRPGVSLGVDYRLTTSCYDPDQNGRSCGRCASYALRRAGFLAAGVPDPTLYVPGAFDRK